MAKHKDITIRAYTDQVRSGDPEARERGIRDKHDAGDSGDWREKDVIVEHPELRVYVKDEAFREHQMHYAIEPDWSQGWYLMDNSNSQIAYEGKGEPPWWVKRALKDGLVIEGILLLRDLQRHN